ncbi:hypothetical protein [Streptomyces mirabilis]|uniref:hypothetical protein n=1 Tax=Streptomyces mirabilis TaxID=68239 RepID=UPI0036777AAF
MGFWLRKRWGGQPVWARWVLAAYLTGFLEGTCAHLLDLARRGPHAYASFPLPLQVFFMSLVVLDPLTAVLVGLLRRNGIRLAGGVTVLDVCANWIGNWPWVQDDPSRLLRPVGLLPITLFGLFVIAFLVPLHLTVTRTGGRSGPRWRRGDDSRVPVPLGRSTPRIRQGR